MEVHKKFKPQAIIFDKDGTLIDFSFMWGNWVVYLADQLHLASRLNIHESLYAAMGYDAKNKKILPHGPLASKPMAHLYQTTVEVMQSLGLNPEEAGRIVEASWYIPDPVLLAKPFTNLRGLFGKIQASGIKIAIATADDRAPTQAMVEAFDIQEFISTMVCADDGIPSKPNPDMVLEICKQISIEPAKVMVIGDTVSDLKMGRTAGAGFVAGVLSGVSSARDLVNFADVLIESIDELHFYLENLQEHETPKNKTDLDPDYAF